ncbi:glycoside hydrolase family 13 protein [Glutamicibacter sp.]|uniref:glycoside hydrolase family 13 protein n=1 Tax=Glutamicibacter sp. TaxID=1931995 RepID=UPI0028BE3995|nr:glycoside hydrolase family 13 protein [Glutamicibacter sp.]
MTQMRLLTDPTGSHTEKEWWRTSVIYQIYPRSFADADGDGMGDLPGITQRLDSLAALGVDAIWLSPFFASPQKDAGYDVSNYCDVDPLFGTLKDYDRLVVRAHDLGLRVIVDLVPNHCSDQHPWFQQALAAAPGSPERDRFIFRDAPESGYPNNWESVFGGPMWTQTTNPDGTPGQMYLHIFDSSQPDFNWNNREVRNMFRDVLRFWLDRGTDGFRVDVAHGLIKAEGLPDFTPDPTAASMGGTEELAPWWGQDGVHEIYRDWRTVLDEYDGARVLCAEAWVNPLSLMAQWVRSDEMHQAFNFPYLSCGFDATQIRSTIDASLHEFGAVGAPSTWVLSNHDVVRHATRLALTEDNPQGEGIGPNTPNLPDPAVGLRRARAATTLMLALPGGAYIYQGEELGLPEVAELPDDSRQDPTWFRTQGERYGRDGCRVPIPWKADAPAAGFSPAGRSWLPQPEYWASFARDLQAKDDASTLSLYTRLLHLRRSHQLGAGSLVWQDSSDEQVLIFSNSSVTVVANFAEAPRELPQQLQHRTQLASSALQDSTATIAAESTIWFAH